MSNKDTASQSQAVPSELASLPTVAVMVPNGHYHMFPAMTSEGSMCCKVGDQLVKLSDVHSLFSHSAATGEAAPAVLDLPSAIMDIPCEPVAAWGAIGVNYYRLGHRDARHAAADLVLKRADELAALASPAAPLAGKAEVETALRKLCDQLENAKRFKHVATGTSQTHSYLEYEDVSRFVEEARKVLSAPLAAAVPAEEASENEWKKFDGESWIDFGKLVDVLLTNGCYEYARPCNRVDWTQVADWRYAAPAEPAPILASALTMERIIQLIDKHTDRDFGLVVEPFARDIESEVLARLSKPTAQGTAPSIDTPEFRAALDAWAQTDCDNAAATADLIAHINRHIAAQAPAGRDAIRDEALEEAAKACEGEKVEDTGTDGDTGYNTAIQHCAAAIRALKSHAAEQASGGANAGD